MQERAELSRIGMSGLAIVTLVVAVAGVPSLGKAATIDVNTTDDLVGSSGSGTQSFRWALNEANTNGDTTNIIRFVFDFATADYGFGKPLTYRQQHRDTIDNAEMFYWLSGKSEEFSCLGGAGWPIINSDEHEIVGRPYGVPAGRDR